MTNIGTVKSANSGTQNVRDIAMAAMSLLRHNPKKLLKKAKRLVKEHPKIARDVFCVDVEGWTLIHACALRGTKTILKTLLSCGVDLNFEMGFPDGLPGNSTCLHLAAYRGDIKIIDYLLSHGANIHAQDSQGHEPIFYAVKRNQTETILYLQDKGAYATNHNDVTDRGFADMVMTPEPKIRPFCFSFHALKKS
ncbi:hypothetical protein SNE40_010860 [Patella caerulea]|uniref:Uncharacterized protein n=1 Tax=Patella caerulea TaxID=87958 RepID=A0AAN8JSU5_PATCE